MTGTRQLDSAYGQLEPWERFQLALAAEARDDERDAERLASTCPRHTYQMCEREFLESLELACEVAHAFAAEILPLAARLDVVEAACEVAQVHFQVLADEVDFAASKAKATKVFRRELSGAIKESGETYLAFLAGVEETVAAEGSTAAHGFAAFCRHELGVEPEILVGAFARLILPTFERLSAGAADPEQVAHYRATLAGVWRYRLGLQPDPSPVATST